MEEVGQYFDYVTYSFHVHRKEPTNLTLLNKALKRTDSAVVAHVAHTQTISKDYAKIGISVSAQDGFVPSLFFIETQLVACLMSCGYEIDGIPEKDKMK